MSKVFPQYTAENFRGDLIFADGGPNTKAMISVILPTYNEAENITRIIPAITKVFQDAAIEGEVIVVDDDSPDGTASIASNLAGTYPVKVHVRKRDRGLSRAVIAGFDLAQGEICVVAYGCLPKLRKAQNPCARSVQKRG